MADNSYFKKRARQSAEKLVNLLKAKAERVSNNPEMAAHQPQVSAMLDCLTNFRDQLYSLHRNSSPSEISELKQRLDSTFLKCDILWEKWETLQAIDWERKVIEAVSNHRNPKVAAFLPKCSAMYQCRVDLRDQLNQLDSDPSVPPDVLAEKYQQLGELLKRCKHLEQATKKEMNKELLKTSNGISSGRHYSSV